MKAGFRKGMSQAEWDKKKRVILETTIPAAKALLLSEKIFGAEIVEHDIPYLDEVLPRIREIMRQLKRGWPNERD